MHIHKNNKIIDIKEVRVIEGEGGETTYFGIKLICINNKEWKISIIILKYRDFWDRFRKQYKE
jgi:hypothetical protein